MANSFDGKIEKHFAQQPTTSTTIFEMCQKVKFKLGKKSKGGVDDNWKRGRKEAETTENGDAPYKKMSISLSICHTGKNWQCAMTLMRCIFRRMCLKAQSNS
jgi:hypothetical protein